MQIEDKSCLSVRVNAVVMLWLYQKISNPTSWMQNMMTSTLSLSLLPTSLTAATVDMATRPRALSFGTELHQFG